MPALFIRTNNKRQRISALEERANDGFWTPGMGEFSTQAALHTVIINPKHTAIVALSQPTPVVAESPVDVPASTTAAQEAASPVATEVEPTPTLAATPSADDLFGVASSTAVKVVYVPESVESNLSSVGAGRLATPTYESAASPTVSAAFVSNVATATSSALDEVVRSTTDDTFSPQSQGEIAVVSTAEPTLPSSAPTTSASVTDASQVEVTSSSTASTATFSLASTRIAVVSQQVSSAPLSVLLATSSLIRESSASFVATSAPISSSTPDKVFGGVTSRIAAVSTGPLASHSSASAAAASSRLSASSASAAASRSTAYRNTPSTPSPSSRSSASNSDDVAASSGQTSTERLFGSIGRSPVSITLTALISAAILAILLGITAFFLRRCYRRRRRVAHRSLGSEGGSPRDGAWGEKDLEEKFEPQVDSDEDEGIDDEAVWRRRVNRLNAMNASRPYAAPVVARSKPQVSVAPEMSPISERMTSSDWTSFVGDGEFGDSTNGSSRKGSVDSQDEAAFIETFSSKGLTADMHPHPLRHSWIPSDDSDSDHSFDEASSRYSPDEESLIAGLPPTPRSRNFSTSPPVSPGQLQPTPRSPSKSGDLQLSLDRLVGSAAEYFGAFFSDDGHSSADHSKTQEDGEAADRFTSFKKPRKAPPTPIIIPPTPRFTSSSPPPVSAPTFPVRAATYTASATEEPSRPVTSRGSNLSFLERSYSDGAAFLGVAHAHVARSVRGKLALAAGREKGLAAGATSWEGVRDSAAVREESEQDSLPQDEAQAQAPAQADNPFDDSNAVASPTVPYNPPSLGRQTPPPTVGLPLLPYLSPFGTSRAANATPVTAEDDKDSNYWSDETTSTVKNYSRPLSMGSTIRPTPRTTTQRQSMLARRVSIASSSSCSSSSSEDEPRPLQRTFSSPELAAAASRRPRPVSTASTGTFGSRESEWEESSSAESVESDSSRAKRERVTRALMSERRRRSEGEVIKRVSGAELSA